MPPESKAPYKAGLAAGIAFASGPLLGVIASFMGTAGAAYKLRSEGGNPATASQLAETQAWSLYSTFIGLAMFPVGVAIIVFCVRRMRRIDRGS